MASSRIAGVNENISTYGGVGLGRDYTAFATWEAATDTDLVTAEQSEVLFICKDQEEYDDKIRLDGATTSEDYRRIIRGAYAEDLTGLPNSMVKFKITTTTFGGAVVQCSENYVVIQDVSVENGLQTGANGYGFLVSSVTECVFVGCLATTTHPTSGIGFFWSSGTTNYAINCLAYNNTNIGFLTSSSTNYLLNCTAYGNVTGFSRTSGSLHCINCLGDTNSTADFAGTVGASSAYNASSDTTAFGTTGKRISQVFAYIDVDNLDFHLAENDTGARGYGGVASTAAVNPSGILYDDDVDREKVVVWSIGFDSDGAFAEEASPCECEGTTGEVEAANGALGYLGVSLITEFGESTKQGQLIQRLLPDLRRRLQQQYRWEFCLRRASYTSADVVEGVPTWGFTYAFLLPTNMLQLWDVGEPHDNPRYRMENKYLLIDDSSVDILYSVEVSDPDSWSASFAEALELKLASKLAMPLLHKPELMQLYEGMFQDKVADAIFLNDIQSDDFSAYSSHLMSARRGFSPREIPLDLS